MNDCKVNNNIIQVFRILGNLYSKPYLAEAEQRVNPYYRDGKSVILKVKGVKFELRDIQGVS